MTTNAGKPWCTKQDAQLVQLARAGKTVAEVAALMGRTPHGIVARADRLSYRVTSIDQHRMLSAFKETARSPAATTPATHGVTEAIEGATGALGLQAHPLLLEVHTEHFYLVMHALEAAGFAVKSRANKPARYVVSDTEKAAESV